MPLQCHRRGLSTTLHIVVQFWIRRNNFEVRLYIALPRIEFQSGRVEIFWISHESSCQQFSTWVYSTHEFADYSNICYAVNRSYKTSRRHRLLGRLAIRWWSVILMATYWALYFTGTSASKYTTPESKYTTPEWWNTITVPPGVIYVCLGRHDARCCCGEPAVSACSKRKVRISPKLLCVTHILHEDRDRASAERSRPHEGHNLKKQRKRHS